MTTDELQLMIGLLQDGIRHNTVQPGYFTEEQAETADGLLAFLKRALREARR